MWITLFEAPSDAPDNFRILRGDETTIHLVWGPPSFQYRNGRVTHYQVRCYIVGSEEGTEKLHNVHANELVLTDLPAATHACFVRAWTKAGSGPWSNRVLFRTHTKAADPPPPTNVQGFRVNPTKILVRWHHPSSEVTISHYVVYHKIEHDGSGKPAGWTGQVKERQATSADLDNLHSDWTYAIRMTSVDTRGNEGPTSATLLVKPLADVAMKSNYSATRRLDFQENVDLTSARAFKIPDYYAVRNLKCAKEEVDNVVLEWLPPAEANHLVEYEIQYTGRKEYFTSLGILKSVHLSEGRHRQSPLKSEAFKPSTWPLDGLIGVDNKPELQHFQLERLEPNSQYEFIVRPVYVLDRTMHSSERQEGISVTIICHTEWTRPTFIRTPDLEMVHMAPVDSPTSAILIELRIFRVSEENGPIHEYFVIAAQERCTQTTEHDVLREPDLYTLAELSQSARQALTDGPYLAIFSTTSSLFKPNQEASIVMLGTEQLSRLRRLAELPTNNSSMREIRGIETAEPYSEMLRAVNKPIEAHCIYRVACRVCSRYPDGQRLCATSNWSNPISPMGNSDPQSLIMGAVPPSVPASGTSAWSLKNPPKITVLLISLTCGLIFFAMLSVVLGCLLKHRKRQMTERHVLCSATQCDARICEDISKSIIADERLKPYISALAEKHGCTPFSEHHGGYMLGRSSSGFHSPSESSLGLSGLKALYPSPGGLATGMVVSTSMNAPSLRSADVEVTPNASLTDEAIHAPRLLSMKNSTQQTTQGTGLPMNACERFGGQDLVRIGGGMKTVLGNSSSFTGRLPIPIGQFVDFVCHTKHDRSSVFRDEFQMIERNAAAMCYSTLNGLLDRNKEKNRCATILPFDHNRVTLQTPTGGCYSDYINASFIDGHQKAKTYIATQAPLVDTTDAFWSMVWNQNSIIIVALTDLIEQAERRCDQYWPNTGSYQYGDITVTQLETTDLAYYVVRTFVVQKSGCMERRKIWQLQYTNWSENPIPTQSVTFMMFIRRVGAVNPHEHGPIIVHCSLGTGRTGLFIALDILLEQIKLEQSVDVFGLVNRLRTQRMRLVESADQYELIYHTIMDAILDGNTEVFARNLGSHVEHLNSIQMNNHLINKTSGFTHTELGYTGFQLEFRKLNSSAPSPSASTPASSPISLASGTHFRYISGHKTMIPSEVANLSINQCKNRIISIVPFEWNRVQLCPIRGVDGSDYINASFVDGYRDKKAYIACQAPTASTVEDFWRMVWEYKSECIVMMCNLNEGGCVKCFKYWPSEKASRYQFFVVDPTTEYNAAGHIVREFKITDARDGESRIVRQMQFTRWPENGVPPSGDSLISLIGQVQKLKAQSGLDGPITVHCRSSANYILVVVAAWSALIFIKVVDGRADWRFRFTTSLLRLMELV
ncbi:receptor-type tyrosine-protein phosphatase S [Clonorchis sinensis]|uniref:protein-tyrosine-phosphatase n=1 Tax=Clonorchis sinensis TaxID=79923 RepID=G7YP07_CLOSI|nr:receptor-type tyrosine-protein phosphatase S [Clonorchis sinensis]